MDSDEKSAGPGASLLLVIGEPFSEDHKTQILDQITKGFRCWDSEDTGININEELANIANRAALGEEGINGERTIQHVSDNLAVDILINPVTQSVKNALKKLLVAPSAVKYIVHAGHAFQDNGAWVLQDDTFEFRHLAQVFKNIDVENGLKQNFEASLTIHTVAENNWGKSISKADFTNSIRIQLNPPQKQDDMHGILQFTAYVGSFIKVVPLTNLLQASEQFGNISFTRPTLYIFPGCEGDSALFGVNGFNLLVNGGYNRRACFWDFARHLDRVDAMLLTHLGSDNIFSMNTVLQRKSLDNIHPQIGYLYCNVPDKLLQSLVENDVEKEEKDPSLLINLSSEGAKLVAMAKRAGIAPHSCLRDDKAKQVDPINLYHKLGHGSLDMYALNPTSDSKELKEFYQQWTKQGASLGMNGPFPSQNALSVCSLLVWKPYNLNDKIVRVLFPGNAPQHKIAEGLEKIKTFDFLKHASCTGRDLLKPVAVKKTRPSSGTSTSRTAVRTTTSRADSKSKTDARGSRTDPKSSASSPTKTTRTSKERDDLTKRLSKPKEKEAKPSRPSSAASTSSMSKSSTAAKKATSPRKSLSPSKSPSPPKTSPAKSPPTPSKSSPKSPAKSPSPPKVVSKEQTPESSVSTETKSEPEQTTVSSSDPAKTSQTPERDLSKQTLESVKNDNSLFDNIEEIPAAVPEPPMNIIDQGAQKTEADQNESLHSLTNGTTEPKEAWVNDDSKAGMFGHSGNMMDNDDEEIKPQALPDPPIVDMGYKEETFQFDEVKEKQEEKDHTNSTTVDSSSSFVFSNDDEYSSDRVAVEHNIQYGISNGSSKRAMGGIQEVDEEENEDGLSGSYGGEGFQRNYSASEEINTYKNGANSRLSSFDENGSDGDAMQKDETESLEKYTKPVDAEDQTFDPLAQWGQPLGLPAPSLPDRRSGTSPTKSASRFGTEAKTMTTSRTSTTSSRTTTTSKSSSTRPASGTARRGASSRSSPPSAKIPPLPPVTPFYVDLTYIPNHGDTQYCDIEFFKRVRARYYVLSSLAPNPMVLDSLMQGKATWEQDDLEVTIIPTYDNETLRHWVGLNKEKLQELHIDMTPAVSRCTIQLQDLETSLPAYRLEV